MAGATAHDAALRHRAGRHTSRTVVHCASSPSVAAACRDAAPQRGRLRPHHPSQRSRRWQRRPPCCSPSRCHPSQRRGASLAEWGEGSRSPRRWNGSRQATMMRRSPLERQARQRTERGRTSQCRPDCQLGSLSGSRSGGAMRDRVEKQEGRRDD